MKNMAGVTPAVSRSAFAALKRVQLQQCVSTAKLWLKSKKSKWVLKPNLLHKKRSPAAPFFYVYFRVNKTQRSQVAGTVDTLFKRRSEERRVGKECRSRWWTYQ